MREESVNSSRQTQPDGNSNSRRIIVSFGGNNRVGTGIAFNSVASSLEPQLNAPTETEKAEQEEKSEKKEAEKVAAAENNNSMSGVRKKLLIPAEEALDSARVAAELVMKDAMEALQRTKQRIMELLHRNSPPQAPPPADEVTKANPEDVIPNQEDNEEGGRTTGLSESTVDNRLTEFAQMHQSGRSTRVPFREALKYLQIALGPERIEKPCPHLCKSFFILASQ
ncbi:unnamed protein product [Calypogeia fissa]